MRRVRQTSIGLQLALIALLTATILQGCAAKQPALRDSVLVVNELVVAASRVEQRAFDDGLVSKVRHDAIGVPLLRVLQAAAAYSTAVQAGGDGAISRVELVAALTEAIDAATDIEAVRLVLVQVRTFLE